jgi:hypothetical protein
MWTETKRGYRQVHIHVDRNHTWVQTGAYSCGQKPYMGTDRCIFMWTETIRGYRQVHIHVDRNHTWVQTGAYSCGQKP